MSSVALLWFGLLAAAQPSDASKSNFGTSSVDVIDVPLDSNGVPDYCYITADHTLCNNNVSAKEAYCDSIRD